MSSASLQLYKTCEGSGHMRCHYSQMVHVGRIGCYGDENFVSITMR